MANRFFEEKSQTQAYEAFRAKPPVHLIEHVIEFLKEKYSGPLSSAIDVGCGTGQMTTLLSPHFEKVLGTDISQEQVNRARQIGISNIQFQISPAETIPAADNSVQLITACSAIHWFDIPAFFKECQRVLCKNGVLAVMGYHFPRFQWKSNSSKDEELNRLFSKMFADSFQKYFHPLVTKYVENEYADIVIPLRDFKRCDQDFIIAREMKLLDYPNFFESFSSFNHMVEAEGIESAQNVVKKFIQDVLDLLADDNEGVDKEDIKLIELNKYFLLYARK